jgi:hypothetical protein
VRSVDLWILRWPSQSLTGEAYVVSGAEVPILGVDVDAIGADLLGVTAVLLLEFFGLWDQVLGLIVWTPADLVQEGEAIPHGNTNLSPKLNSCSCLAANNRTNLPLNQVDDAVRDAARLGVQQDRLLSVQLADHEKLLPPIRPQAGKACSRSDQGVNRIKIPLQLAELAAYCGFYLPPAWLLLFGDIKESDTCPTTIISRPELAKI